MKQRKIITTSDNSKSLLIPELDETYHSRHGAIAESQHVFIGEGLDQIDMPTVKILEMGFGTGLNALLTLKHAIEKNKTIQYTTIEKYPLLDEEVAALNYVENFDREFADAFMSMHTSGSGNWFQPYPSFRFKKIVDDVTLTDLPEKEFNLVFYDAFAPRVQSYLWDKEVLKKMFDSLKVGGILVTYCAQGQFRRNLKDLGFEIEKPKGPPGKREMTRAIKKETL